MSNTVIAGKPSTTFGDKDSQLILRGSSIKVQWGNKFIDLIKNGKINCENDQLLQSVNSQDEIIKDGIYLIKDQVWVSIGGTNLQISEGSSTTYVSFLSEQPETTIEQKNNALKNIGFYYKSLEDIQNAKINSGIVFNLEDNKLYVIHQNKILEYNQFVIASQTSSENFLKSISIQNNQLMLENQSYITFSDYKTIFNQDAQFEKNILSSNASNNFGYRLYMQGNQSYLEVDTIIERNAIHDYISAVAKICKAITPISITKQENGKVNIQFDKNSAPTSNILYTIGTVYLRHEINNDTLTISLNKKLNYEVSITVNTKVNDEYVTSSYKIPTNNNLTISLAGAKFVGIDFEPFTGIFKYTANETITDDNYTTLTISEGDLFLLNVTKIYDNILPPNDSKFNNFIPNIGWITQLLESTAVSVMSETQFSNSDLPIGSIILYNSNVSNIPDGWAICDGNNNTPDLSDRFISQGDGKNSIIYITKVSNFI